MKIASDTPKDIIEALRKIDFSKVTPSMLAQLPELERMANIHIPDRKYEPKYIDIDVIGCPQQLINLINKKDFTKVGLIVKAMAMPIIKSWIRNNLPMKAGMTV